MAVLLGVVAVGIAAYLTVVHYQHDLLVCSTGGCETVQSSKYATIGPIPIAILGLASSVTMLGAALLRIFRRDLVVPATVVIFALAAIGFGYELYLTYVEIWVLDAICQWCVAFACVTTIWMVLEARRLWEEL
ncbi:hypothetical protein BH09CHL1_BH09CHL1_02300 [soil metagenome]